MVVVVVDVVIVVVFLPLIVIIGNASSGYTSAPTLSFPGAGSGTGASATAMLGTGASATAVIGTGASASINGAFTHAKRMLSMIENYLKMLVVLLKHVIYQVLLI